MATLGPYLTDSDIDQFCELATKLITDLGIYAAEMDRDDDHSGGVRRLRTVNAALSSALDQVRMMPPRPPPPPAPAAAR